MGRFSFLYFMCVSCHCKLHTLGVWCYCIRKWVTPMFREPFELCIALACLWCREGQPQAIFRSEIQVGYAVTYFEQNLGLFWKNANLRTVTRFCVIKSKNTRKIFFGNNDVFPAESRKCLFQFNFLNKSMTLHNGPHFQTTFELIFRDNFHISNWINLKFVLMSFIDKMAWCLFCHIFAF